MRMSIGKWNFFDTFLLFEKGVKSEEKISDCFGEYNVTEGLPCVKGAVSPRAD